jgi:FAD:protein FMN transferase
MSRTIFKPCAEPWAEGRPSSPIPLRTPEPEWPESRSRRLAFGNPATLGAANQARRVERRFRVFPLALGIALSACDPYPQESELSGEVQGTTYHIKMVLGVRDSRELADIRASIQSSFEEIDRKLSNYREDSEISRFNRQNSTDWIPVSREISGLVWIAKQVHEKTQGCYDLTVKPLFDLWGFSKHSGQVPGDDAIAETLKHVGMSQVEVDTVNSRIRRADGLIRIDLASIAQGYTVAAIATVLESRGISNYLAEVGGEMKVRGRKANGNPWRVAVEKPTPYTREVERIFDIHEEAGTAIMTAGTYRNFFEEQGQVYSHILDPRTGKPVAHQLLSVTVLHEDPTWADAWDTALLCVGEKPAKEIAEREGLKTLLIYREGSQLREYMSPAMSTAEQRSQAAK